MGGLPAGTRVLLSLPLFSISPAQVLDGPYDDNKEQFGGYYTIDVPDLDTGLPWAARCPAVQYSVVEVRAIREREG
jgi:hypothetical protein